MKVVNIGKQVEVAQALVEEAYRTTNVANATHRAIKPDVRTPEYTKNLDKQYQVANRAYWLARHAVESAEQLLKYWKERCDEHLGLYSDIQEEIGKTL